MGYLFCYDLEAKKMGIEQLILSKVSHLPLEQQCEVLNFVEFITSKTTDQFEARRQSILANQTIHEEIWEANLEEQIYF
jgi:hypothetical protein